MISAVEIYERSTNEKEVCIHCHEPIVFGAFIVGEWSHWHGDRYCHNRTGFTATPLQIAQPAFHPVNVVL